MRSPPSKRASFGSNAEKPSPSFSDFEKLSSSVLRGAPDSVVQDLIATKQQDSIGQAQIDRDRRLRQLIRRYQNQIQHGCHNRNCTAPTCLSYRSRNSKVPLRPYTDISARSLACHLVEECAKDGRDPTLGLCSNQPVVPWFQGEKRRKPRKHSSNVFADAETQNQPGPPNGHVHSPRRGNRRTCSPSTSQLRPPQQAPGWEGESQQKPEAHVDQKTVHIFTPTDDEPNKTSATQPFQMDATGSTHEPSDSEPSQGVPCPHPKRDLASFVQSIWDTFSLRNLAKPSSSSPPSPTPLPGAPLSEPITRPDEPINGDSKSSDLHEEPRASKTPQALSLRRLSYKTILWLHDREAAVDDDTEMPFYHFIKQNIHFALGDPVRLCQSADTWTDSENEEDEHPEGADQQRSSKQPSDKCELPSTTPEPASSRKPSSKFNLTKTVSAFEMVADFEASTDDLYAALHSALQRCYKSSSPVKDAKEDRKLKLQSLKMAGGGFWDASHEKKINRAAPTNSQIAQTFLLVLVAAIMPIMTSSLEGPCDNSALVMATLADIKNDGHASFNAPYSPHSDSDNVDTARTFIEILDHFDDRRVLKLGFRLADCISHHIAAAQIARYRNHSKKPKHLIDIALDRLVAAVNEVAPMPTKLHPGVNTRCSIGFGIMELARSVLLREWDREPVIQRTSAVGGALELLAALFCRSDTFYISETFFYMPFLWRHFDEMEMPMRWLDFKPSGKRVHLLNYSFLFNSDVLVRYWRIINVTAMRRRHEEAVVMLHHVRSFLIPDFNALHKDIPIYGGKEILKEMRPLMDRYFVMTVRRSHVLEDAINQIWRRQRREILRPLRVKLGKDEGEDGLDHGGVQQEFCRLLFAESFDEDKGMFTIDEKTRMTWFQPGSLEPLYKFEALGILMSLALYNSVTLPITMPLAFYRKLLGLKVKKLEHIEDGWPDLAKGLKALLKYEGNVAEAIGRTYEFSYEFAGKTVNIDMSKADKPDSWSPIPIQRAATAVSKGKEKVKSTSFELPLPMPSDITPPSESPNRSPLSPMNDKLSRTSSFKDAGISTPVSLDLETMSSTAEDTEAPLVTNATRDQYVKDYIHYLTTKSIRRQFDAFARGFFTCVDERALKLFTSNPRLLREIVEGAAWQRLDLQELRETSKYDGFDEHSEYIDHFWDALKELDEDDSEDNTLHGKVSVKLLEFVTASSRVPVGGLEKVAFIIQKNGDAFDTDAETDADGDDKAVDKEVDARLPTSSTCYGRLLLPRYSSKTVLRERLAKALEWSVGFGVL